MYDPTKPKKPGSWLDRHLGDFGITPAQQSAARAERHLPPTMRAPGPRPIPAPVVHQGYLGPLADLGDYARTKLLQAGETVHNQLASIPRPSRADLSPERLRGGIMDAATATGGPEVLQGIAESSPATVGRGLLALGLTAAPGEGTAVAAHEMAPAVAPTARSFLDEALAQADPAFQRRATESLVDALPPMGGQPRRPLTVTDRVPGRFAILTAENPGGVSATPEANAASNAALEGQIRDLGYHYQPVKGRYQDPTTGEVLNENSFLIHDIHEPEARGLATSFGQNGVITDKGYHDLVAGKIFPSRGINAATDLPYTEFPNGDRFALDINWNEPLTGGHAPNPDVLKLTRALRTGQNAEGRDLAFTNLPRVTSIDKARAEQMARVYEQLPTNDPNARPAYDALNAEVSKQYKALQDAGYKFEFVNEDPYKNSKEMMADVRDNKRLKVLKTPGDNFHPYMTPEQNDQFRAVHDLLAHAGEGHQFGPVGEENAYRVHASTLSPLAQRALATETRGQNSWVNFGPNAHLPVRERPFAQQKAALWPEGMLGDYGDFPQEPTPVPEKQPYNKPTYQADSTLANLASTGFAFGKPATAVELPVAGAGRGGSTATAMRVALSKTTPDRFRQLVDAEIAKRGGATSPEVEMAATEEVARKLASEEPAIRGDSIPSSLFPPQRNLDRFVGPKIPQQRVDDVEHEAHKLFTSPAFEQLLRSGNHPDWYDTRRMEQMAVDALGPEEGPKAFRDLMAKMAATTAKSQPGVNLRSASYYRGLDLAGLLHPDELRAGSYKGAPQPMGHLAQGTHHNALASLKEAGDVFDSRQYPKSASFFENLNRNFRPYTNDTRMTTGSAQMNPKLVEVGGIERKLVRDKKTGKVTESFTPRNWGYAPMERAAQRAAEEHAGRGLLDVPHGADPTAFWQAKIWDALGGLLGGSASEGTMSDVFDRKLAESAKAWGVSLDEANRLFWEGHPLDLPLNNELTPPKLRRGLLKP